MPPTVRLAGVLFPGDPAPDWPGAYDFAAEYRAAPFDGIAVWRIDRPDDDVPLYAVQPFRQGPPVIHGDATVPAVWTWDGDTEAPTLTPDFAWNMDGDAGCPRLLLALAAGVPAALEGNEADLVDP